MRSAKDNNQILVQRYERWLVAMQYAKRTRLNYCSGVWSYVRFLKNKSVLRSTHFDIRDFLASESIRGLSYVSVCMHFYSLHSFFTFLNIGGLIQRVTPSLVHLRPRPKTLPHVLSESGILRVINASRNSRDLAIVELLYETGCRVSELVNIKVSDIEFQRRRIRVVGKGSRERYVIFGPLAATAVKDYLNGRETGYLLEDAKPLQVGYVGFDRRRNRWTGKCKIYGNPRGTRRSFHTDLGQKPELNLGKARVLFKNRLKGLNLIRPRKGRPLDPGSIRRVLNILATRASLTTVTPHMIRHSFATHMLDRGAQIRDVKELLGHSSLRTTEIYVHLSRPNLVEAFDRYHPRGLPTNDTDIVKD